jgi:hypothetical protein
MKNACRPLVALLVSTSFLASGPLRADNDAAKIAAGAAAILGVAVLAHKNQNHRDDKHHSTPEKEAAYERGYQDGLHNASYRPSSDHESSYREGYDAGVDERGLRTAHNRDHEWEEDRHAAPRFAMKACIEEASSSTDISAHSFVPVTSRKSGGNYQVEVAAGYRHYTCTVDDEGEVRGMRDGSI